MKCLKLLVLLVALPTLRSSRTAGKMIPMVYSANVTMNSKLLNGSLVLHNVKGRKDVPNLSLSLCPLKVVTDAWIHAKVSMIPKRGTMHAPIYDSKTDFCDFLRQPYKYHLMSLVYDAIRRFGHIPTGCPITPGWYVFPNISMLQIKLPAFLSEADFQIDITSYRPGKENYLKAQIRGALKRL